MYWVYILRSEKDKKFYIGSTSDIIKRLKAHNAGRVRSTKSRRPVKLIYKEEYETVTEARKRENVLKTSKGRRWIKENIY